MSFCLEKKTEMELRAIPGNSLCVDCDARGPQWASVSFGIFMCLECSGKHRSLGVHISFVRSVTMDSWTSDQIQLMRIGGNSKCNDYLAQYNALAKPPGGGACNIYQKYNSSAAALYARRLQAEQAGKPLPTELPQQESDSSSSGSNGRGGGGSAGVGVEPIKGESEAEYVQRQVRLREEAQERLRQKFGKSGGLKGSSGMQGIGSDTSYRPGGGGGGGGGASGSSDSYGLPSLGSLGITEEGVNRVKEDAAKALDSTWSFLGSSFASLTETVSSVAADVSATVQGTSIYGGSGSGSGGGGGNSGGGGRAGGQAQPQSNGPRSTTTAAPSASGTSGAAAADDDWDKNWEFVKSSAFDFWSKASEVTSEVTTAVVKTIAGDGDDGPGAANGGRDDSFFPRSQLAGLSSGKMKGLGAASLEVPTPVSQISRSDSGSGSGSGGSLSSSATSSPRGGVSLSGGGGGGGGGQESTAVSMPRVGSANSVGSAGSSGNGSSDRSGSGKSSTGAKKLPVGSGAGAGADDDFFNSFGVK